MTSLHGRTALVLGGSAGIGLATVHALANDGAHVTAVARGITALAPTHDSTPGRITTRPGDATDPAFVREVMQELQPGIVVLSAGIRPPMASIEAFDWAAFSAPWEQDTRAAFNLVQAALTLPLRTGTTIVIVSSGAAVRGSPLSGGYAGAKRMQWYLANYAQSVSTARQLGIRFVAVVPEQLVAGTAIGEMASSRYAAVQGITAEQFMNRYDVQLTPESVAATILGIIRGEVLPDAPTIGIRGTGSVALT